MATQFDDVAGRHGMSRARRLWIPVADTSPSAFRRGALSVTRDPPELRRHGMPIQLSPTELVLMALLIRRGRAPHVEIVHVLREAGANPASLDVMAFRIRRKFAAAAAPDPIESRRGWGLILRVEPDIYGSTALWIGETDMSARRFPAT